MANNYDTTTKFKVDISELKKAMQEAKRQVSVANSEFKAITSTMDNWSKSTDGIKAKLTQLDSNLKSQKTILANLEKQYELTVKEMGEGSAQAEKLKVAINNQKAVVNNTQKEYNAFEKELDRVAKAEEIAGKTGKNVSDVLDDMDKEASEAKESVSKLSDGFTVMKGVLANLVADGIRVAIGAFKDLTASVVETGKEFDISMSKVQAVAGASADEMVQLRDKAKEMGANTIFSASDVADAFNYMAMAGWKTEDMLSGIEGVLNLASASGTDLAITSDIVTDALTAMGYGAEDAGRLADVMATASSNANTNVEMMGETFKYCAGTAGALGYNMEDVALAVGLMGNSGIKASQAGTALNNIFTRMAKPTKESATAMERLGISLADDEGNMYSFREIMLKLRESFGHINMPLDEFNARVAQLDSDLEEGTLTQSKYDKELEELIKQAYGAEGAEKARAGAMLAGQRGMAGLLAITNATEEDFNKLTDALDNSKDSAKNMSAVMQDNLGGDMTALGSKIEGIQIALYEKLEPALREAVGFVQDLADEFSEWLNDPENKEALDELTNNLTTFVKDALTNIVTFVKWFIQNKDNVVAGIVAIGSGLLAWNVASMIQGVVKAVKAFQLANEGATVAQGLLNLAMEANPIGIVIALITALVGAIIYLWNNSEEFRAFWINLWETVKTWASNAIDTVVSTVSELPERFSEWLNATIEKVTTWATNMGTKASEAGKSFIDNIINHVKTLGEKVWTWLTNVITKVTSFASNLRAKATEAGNGFVNTLVEAVSGLPDKFSEIGSNIVSGIWNGISAGWTWLTDNVRNLANNLLESAKNALDIHSPSRKFRDLVGKQIPAGIAVGVKDNASVALNSVKTLANDMVTGAHGSLGAVGGNGGVVNNFYQTNNSPKALSRLEIYRQSKNLLGYAGGGF